MDKSAYKKLRGSGVKPVPVIDFDPFAKPKPKSDAVVTPGEPKQTEPSVEAGKSAATAREQTTPVEAPGSSNKTSVEGGRLPFITEVNKTEKLITRTSAMYPSRHTQLGDMAYWENRKPWQIIDQALEEYVKRHHSNKKGKS
ncbi:hypothetical protein ACKI1I_46425 [Streptomyces turgidiscabies]|uniref:hypothetical protein n=1 Tax=Streptomyces TaxID=1883 RepID=UPI00076EA687|nr:MULTISPECIES: hypothetical protein [Streptomyces]MDX3494548.1 hypothetical protein [Streptomyces turgidiscabies]GAQ76418.1 hypothetical protein T45_08213 [Streptomyces turgidiscabies]